MSSNRPFGSQGNVGFNRSQQGYGAANNGGNRSGYTSGSGYRPYAKSGGNNFNELPAGLANKSVKELTLCLNPDWDDDDTEKQREAAVAALKAKRAASTTTTSSAVTSQNSVHQQNGLVKTPLVSTSNGLLPVCHQISSDNTQNGGWAEMTTIQPVHRHRESVAQLPNGDLLGPANETVIQQPPRSVVGNGPSAVTADASATTGQFMTRPNANIFNGDVSNLRSSIIGLENLPSVQKLPPIACEIPTDMKKLNKKDSVKSYLNSLPDVQTLAEEKDWPVIDNPVKEYISPPMQNPTTLVNGGSLSVANHPIIHISVGPHSVDFENGVAVSQKNVLDATLVPRIVISSDKPLWGMPLHKKVGQNGIQAFEKEQVIPGGVTKEEVSAIASISQKIFEAYREMNEMFQRMSARS